jgi:hypothetical protein
LAKPSSHIGNRRQGKLRLRTHSMGREDFIGGIYFRGNNIHAAESSEMTHTSGFLMLNAET